MATKAGFYRWEIAKNFIQGFTGTLKELAEKLGCHHEMVRTHVDTMHRHGILYVSGYTRIKTVSAKVWSLRQYEESDAPRPKPLTDAEKSKRARKERKRRSEAVRLGIWGL